MDTYHLTFGDCVELLRRNGYAPTPLSPETGRPLGPFAMLQMPLRESDNALPAGVLTAVPMAVNEASPVRDAPDTWLATITVRVRTALVDEVEAVLARHIGEGKRLHRVNEDGALRIVLRLTHGPFFTHNTGTHDGDQYVRVSAGPAWLPLAGDWSLPGGPLVVQRAELPGIDTERAAALVEAVDNLLCDHDAPLPVYKPKPIKALPDLAKGEPLHFGDAQAVRALKDNGYGICPVPWGSDRPSNKWWMTGSVDVHWGAGAEEMGVGAWCRGPTDIGMYIAALEVTGADAEQVRKADAALVGKLGVGMLRTAADGTRLRLYAVPRYGGPKHDAVWIVAPEPFEPGKGVHVRVISDSAVVFSGADASGRPFTWPEGSPLTTPRDALPTLQLMTDQHGRCPDYLRTALVAALSSPADAATATRRRSRA